MSDEQDEQFIPLQDVPAYIQGLRNRISELEAVLFEKGEALREARREPFFTLAQINERRAQRDAEIAQWKADARRWRIVKGNFVYNCDPGVWYFNSWLLKGDTIEQSIDRLGEES